MQFQLPIDIPALKPPIQHSDYIMLTGSCFTEHISRFLRQAKWRTSFNSHGILFNPISVAESINDLLKGKQYSPHDLFYHHEYWHSWKHHSDFSSTDQAHTLELINQSIVTQQHALQQAQVIIITLGSAFAYWHLPSQQWVANNHRLPHHEFQKTLLDADTIRQALQSCISNLHQANPSLRVILTISPVRHIRDGVIDNNRSKARLIEAVHALTNVYYFPAYELVIDVLRDYRFYDMDMVHPNYQATQYVWQRFVEACIDPRALPLMKQCEQIHRAKTHRPKNTTTQAHQHFLQTHHQLCTQLLQSHPYIDMSEELRYFSQTD